MDSRMLVLNETADTNGKVILYVMSRDQRTDDNHALLAAQAEALKYELPLVVAFNLYTKLGERRREHFEFMTEGLKQVEQALAKKDIAFVKLIGSMPKNILTLAKQLQPRTIYFDFSPLHHSRTNQKKLANVVDCRVIVVDTHNIVPVWVTSDKEEYAAHTIRRKLHKNIEEWCVEPAVLMKHPHLLSQRPSGVSWSDIDATIDKIPTAGIDHGFVSGEAAAKSTLDMFIETGFTTYAGGRNDPTADSQSNLSPYLHYGQISALRITLEIVKATHHRPHLFTSFKMPSYEGAPTEDDGVDAFLEELIVRKELSDNFCFYNPNYDNLNGAKDWAKQTLARYADDPREFIYTRQQLEDAMTHDELWNAAQLQLRKSGKIHGYMRMYWAKKILEWSQSSDHAIKTAVMLNDRYHLDGGDPNGYVGVMWSMAGVHDRPWFERSVYGQIRYMSANGLRKKFDTEAYKKRWLTPPLPQ